MKAMIKKWVGLAIDSSKRFSVTIFFAFAYVIYKILVEEKFAANAADYYISLFMILMILSSGLIHVMFQGKQGSNKWFHLLGANLAAAALWGGYAYYHFSVYGIDFPMWFVLQVFVLGVSLCAGFAVFPFLRRPVLGNHLLRLTTNLAIAGLFSLVLLLGVAFILYTLYVLFSLPITRALYDFAIIVSHLVFPVIFLMMYPRYEWEQLGSEMTEEEAESICCHDSGDIQMVYRVVLNYIAMPLLLIYTVILYTYILSTLMAWEMPVNSYSYLVSFFLIVSLLTIYLLKGYEHHRNVFESWIHKSLGYFAVSLVLPTICMLYGMFVRIAYYGVTVPRYYIVLLGLFAIFALSLLFFLGKRAQSALVVAFVCTLFVSAFGYFSASEVTFRSQAARISKIVGEEAMVVRDQQVIGDSMSQLSYEEIRDLESSVHVIAYLGYLDRINPVLYDSVNYGYQYVNVFEGEEVAPVKKSATSENYIQYYYNQSESMYVASEVGDVWQLILLDHDMVVIPGFIRVESDGSSITVYNDKGLSVETIALPDLVSTGFGVREISIKDVSYQFMVMIDHAYISESTMDGAFRVIITVIKSDK